MKQLTRTSLAIVLKNWTTLLLFEVLYKIISYSILYTVIKDALSVILKLLDVSYLGTENFSLLFKNPLAMLFLLLVLILAAFFVFFEIVALYLYCEFGWRKEKVSVTHLLRHTFYCCKQFFSVPNLLFLLCFILTTILAIFPFSPYLMKWLHVPEFIEEFIYQNRTLTVVYFAAVFVLNVAYLLILFVLMFAILEEKRTKEALRESIQLLKTSKFKILLQVLGTFVVVALLTAGTLCLASLSLVAYTKLSTTPSEAASQFKFYFSKAAPAAGIVVSSFAATWLFSVIIILFHNYKREVRPNSSLQEKYRTLDTVKGLSTVVCVIIVVLLFSESEFGKSAIYPNDTNISIIAHRGGAAVGPENTIAALNAAITMRVETAEIDVQQLKDGSIVLLHDSNFKRTTGQDKDVWEVDGAEVKNYDAGSLFSKDFTNEPVPTLAEALRTAKGHIHLMIEIKLSGHEQNLVKQVLEQVEEYDMMDECSIASLSLEVLKETKQINPKIKTVYITPMLLSDQYNIDYVDSYSIETTAMTKEMVLRMQQQNKKVYGWTANSAETVEKTLRCHVDGVVTDHPTQARYYILNRDNDMVSSYLIKTFFNASPGNL
ncbi:glycerophosphodiester phosphodiesterase family protein [Pygmaiobacter massiliensis]|uniref:glycerophosphodiester phosphodiesterase family protein n=1 Tax=Pygmaiobacter massiliensis TaxID=1917873 RepID=UPI000C7AFF50|nr:glycerophosphodiester phosphodiesterase family protein [Pygmaiobacter massiliensis]